MKYLLLLLAVLLASCTSQSDKTLKTESAELVLLKSSLDSLFNSKVGRNDPGAALLVSYNGEMLVGKGYGLRDLENNQPITSSTNMRMASVSKQFTALTILRLVDEGKLSLSDSVYNLFPIATFKDATTIQQLINHTSGKSDAEDAFLEEWDSTKIATNKDILDWYSSENRTITQPGEAFQYNNGIYEFIPNIVEKVSGQDFARFAKEEVFQKAGMLKTNFFNLADPVEIEERAFCYEKGSLDNWKKVDGHFLNGLLGAGGVYTSVEDYFQYDLALRNETLLTNLDHSIIFNPTSTDEYNGKRIGYAMGWNIMDSSAEHSGGWFGTNTFTKRYLDKPLTLAIFMNSNTLFELEIINIVDSLVVEYANTTMDEIQE